MNYTDIPIELIYRERGTLASFGIYETDSLNAYIYKLLRRRLVVDMGLNNYAAIIKRLLNEAYYLCTLFLADPNSETHFRDYIESVMMDSPYPEKITDALRTMVYGMVYVYLEKISLRSLALRTIRRYLRNYCFEFLPFMGELTTKPLPTAAEFKPVTLKKELLADTNWKEITNDFELERVEFFIQSIGRSNSERRMLVYEMYSAMVNSGIYSRVAYQVDSLMIKAYVGAKGSRNDLLNLSENRAESEVSRDMESRIRDRDLMIIKLRQNMEMLQARNKVLTAENITLREQLSQSQRISAESLQEMKLSERMERELREKLREMEVKAQQAQEKLGTKVVELTTLVDGVKRYARFKGLEAGKDMFMSLNYLLMGETAWVKNVRVLEDFFIDTETQLRQPLMQLENKGGGIVQITSKE